jgi:hypothetical protein
MPYDYSRGPGRRVTADLNLQSEWYGAMDRIKDQTRKLEAKAQLQILKEAAHYLANFDLVLDPKKSSLEMVRVGSDQREAWAYLHIEPAKGASIGEERVKMAVWDVTKLDPKFIKKQGTGWMVHLAF